MINRINELMQSWGITQAKLCKDLDLPSSTFRTWKKGACPSADNLYKVANYFNVSVEYLLTGIKAPAYNLSEEEKTLIENYRRIELKNKELLIKISNIL